MAEYKALAQNTYKFVTETTLLHTGNIGSTGAPQVGRAKLLTSKGEVLYVNVGHYGRTTEATATTLAGKTYSSTSGNSAISTIGLYLGSTAMNASCTVDGIQYYGLRNAQYALHFKWDSNTTAGSTITLPGGDTYPACRVKIVKYLAAGGSISVIEKTLNTVITTEVTQTSKTGTTNGTMPGGYQAVLLTVEKTTDDIILSISIEYDAYALNLSGSASLQYSVDNGMTFHDVTHGTSFDAIEHIIFKNTSDSATCYIGTAEGSSNIASIPIGKTVALPITADSHWYVS